MNKKKYTAPEAEVELFTISDVITDSQGQGGDYDTEF